MTLTDLSLHYLVRPPAVESTRPALLILLHGVGSNEEDLFGLSPYLDERLLILSTRAPLTLARGSYAWFHVQLGGAWPQINAAEADSSRRAIIQFIGEAARVYGADAGRVFLMGFSQGAIMSQSVMLTQPELLAGVVAMSGRILPEIKPLAASPERMRDFPILVQHGLYDQVLPIAHGRASREYLATLPVQLTYREYPMAHEVTDESLADAREWLKEQLDHLDKKAGDRPREDGG
jgi:phospholipase/carboxylesterase